MSSALIVLEDGTALAAESVGAAGTAFGEVVFNTAMTGYQEVLTDPSYHRQIVVMTSSHQGNYGLNPDDAESDRLQVAGFVVRAATRRPSSHRATQSLPDALAEAGVVGVAGADTRLLVRRIRERGALRGAVSTETDDADGLLAEVVRQPLMAGAELASAVTTPRRYEVPAAGPARHRVVCLDFGLKRNQLRLLAERGCDVVVVPAATPAADMLALGPDGVFLSNGPGDPAAVLGPVRAIRELLSARVPVFGICLGHQLLGVAVGAKSYKLPFGHHGANQPIRNLARGSVEIASHNHGFAIDAATLPGPDGEFGAVAETHVNLNDGTNAGLALTDLPAFSVQYHPEAAPGPHDSRYLFDDFCGLLAERAAGGAR